MAARLSAASLALATALLVSLSSGCAVRYDATGMHRIGIGLWGFGDPPGVDWSLDRPRSEVPELPPARRRDVPELPPLGRRDLDERRSGEAAGRSLAMSSETRAGIIDNRERAFDRGPAPAHLCAAAHAADPCDGASVRGS